jgi:hypothetical protein
MTLARGRFCIKTINSAALLLLLGFVYAVSSCRMVNNLDLDKRVSVHYYYNIAGKNTDGAHSMGAERWIAGKSQDLAKNVFAVSGASGLSAPVFLGWSTSPNSPKIVFTDGQDVTFTRDADLYAVWGTAAEKQTALYTAFNTLNTLSANAGGLLVNYTINLDATSTSMFVVPGGSIALGEGSSVAPLESDDWRFPALKAVTITLTSTGRQGSGKAGSSGDKRVLMPEPGDASFWKLLPGSSISYKSEGIVTADGFDGQDGLVLDKDGKVRMYNDANKDESGAFEIDTASPAKQFTFSPAGADTFGTGAFAYIRVYGSTAWGAKTTTIASKTTDTAVSLPVATNQKARVLFIRNSNTCMGDGTFTYLFFQNFDITVLKGDISNLYGGPLTGAPASLMNNTLATCSNLRSIGQLVLGRLSSTGASPDTFANTFGSCTNLTGESAKVWNGTDFVPLYQAIKFSSTPSFPPYSCDTGLSDYNSMPGGWK